MGFDRDSPITAGTVLVRSDIRSQNYQAGVSGWIILADGSAEFNNVTVRGQFETDGPNGSYVRIDVGTGVDTGALQSEILLNPPSNTWVSADKISPATIRAYTFSPVSNLAFSYMSLDFIGPRWSAGSGAANLDYPIISLRTALYNGLDPQTISIGSFNADGSTNLALDGNMSLSGTLKFIGNPDDAGKGIIDVVGDVANSAAISTVETVTLTSSNISFKPGRAYAVDLASSASISAAPARAVSRIRKTNTAGQQIGLSGHQFANTGTGSANWRTVFYIDPGGTTVSAQLVWTGLVNSGATAVTYLASADAPRTMTISDIGPSTRVSAWGGPQLL